MEFVFGIIAVVAAGVAVWAYGRVSDTAKSNKALESELRKVKEEAERGRADGIKVAELETELKKEREGFERERAAWKEAESNLKTAFENVGNRIFDASSEKFAKQNQKGLETILSPLKNDIRDFKDKFAKTGEGFAGKFGELKSQIEGLKDLNKTIGAEAQNLTKALKGDSKQRGNWGELVLEKTLEMSGLRKGREYEVQETMTGEGGRRVLDVLVRLPDDKDIVIDSKVSLVAYDGYCSSGSEAEKAEFLKSHIRSVESHIKELGEKNYQNLPGIRSLNYVLLFVPIESAYILTVNESEGIFQRALDRNIVLVCPSTLLAVLRTVHSLWRMEDRNRNAQEIAEEAGKLYDKFAGFVDKMDTVKKQLATVGNNFDDAYKSLSTGRGNLIGRAEKMKQLGAKTSKSLPPGIVEKSADEEGLS
ncbi:MAG: DNA recombination protein RmuC [Candidatus Dadabacteria bacterium]|nr:DNA recombination protein RmuC [Candidatus Dadabacteria bacterium]